MYVISFQHIYFIRLGYSQGRRTAVKTTSATSEVSRLFDRRSEKRVLQTMFRGFEAKKFIRTMARWHWLERRPWLFGR